MHNITCHSAEIKGDVAHTESYVMFVLASKDYKTVNVGGGRYIDRIEKRNGEWKISLRRLVMDWRFEADASNWTADTRPYARGTWDHSDTSYQRPLELPPNLKEALRLKGKPPTA